MSAVIEVTVALGSSGIQRLESTGHAPSRGGGSVVCAAVSALLRSAAEALGDTNAVVASGHAPEPGRLTIEVGEVRTPEWLEGLSDMLLAGLRRIAAENPDEVRLSIYR